MSAVQTSPDFPSVSLRDVESLSDFYAEPDWMRAARHDAWALAQEMPLPHQKEEAWRRTPLHRFPLDSLRVALAGRDHAALDDLPPCWHHNMAPGDLVSGTLVHCNDANSYQTMRPEDVYWGDRYGRIRDAFGHVWSFGARGQGQPANAT